MSEEKTTGQASGGSGSRRSRGSHRSHRGYLSYAQARREKREAMVRWKRRLWLALLAGVVVLVSVYIAVQFADPGLPAG